MNFAKGTEPQGYFSLGQGSFYEFLKAQGMRPKFMMHDSELEAPHGTTIIAATYADGVVMAGDRRATMGNLIASREIEKVYVADDYSCIGVAGTAGIAVELVRLFQVELEHYEKIEGLPLSIEGKANRLSSLLRENLELAMAGLPVIPLFAGVEPISRLQPHSDSTRLSQSRRAQGIGRIFSYDATGGCYEETEFHAVGSGSMFAKGSLKKLYAPQMDAAQITRVVIEALCDAADDDSATAGPDLVRGIFPIVAQVDAQGCRLLHDDELRPVVESVLADREVAPNGPRAQVRSDLS